MSSLAAVNGSLGFASGVGVGGCWLEGKVVVGSAVVVGTGCGVGTGALTDSVVLPPEHTVEDDSDNNHR